MEFQCAQNNLENSEFFGLERNIGSEKKLNSLIVNGIPFQSSKADLVRFFDGYYVKEEDIEFLDHLGKFSGKAIVAFETSEIAKKAMIERQRAYLGTRYLELSEYF